MSKLALDGGTKACPTPLPFWPHYEQGEIDEVVRLLQSGKVNQWSGDSVKKFEVEFAKTIGQPHAVAVFNGTLALELALISLGIGKGDEVIVTPRSFIASASCVVSCGAIPVFADIDEDSQNITPSSIEAVISSRTKAIIPVHLNGWPCDMPKIMELAQENNLFIIEDCAQSHGAKIDDNFAGSFAHASVFSFCQDKIISTGGEGGIVLFRNKDIWQKAWSYKDHGKNYNKVFNNQHPSGFRWLHDNIGTNWRMTSIQAAIGLQQLKKLRGWNKQRNEIAARLKSTLEAFPSISVPTPKKNIEHAWYRFSFHIDESQLKTGWSRNKIMSAINAEGVGCIEVCPEIYKEKAFNNIPIPTPNCPNTIKAGKKILLLKINPMIDKKSLKQISHAIEKVLKVASS